MLAIEYSRQNDRDKGKIAIFGKFYYVIMIQNIFDFLQNTPPTAPSMIALLITVGFFVGFLNTVAGLATIISYGLFMAMGMPINIANGTTRLGVLTQFSASSYVFNKEGYLDIKLATKIGIPVAIGSFFGAQLAAYLNPKYMEITMGILLPLLAVLLLLDTKSLAKKRMSQDLTHMNIWKFLVFIIVGCYGGFTHAGVGILILFGAFFMLGVDLVKANALKQFAVLIYTPIALTIFISHGQVNWPVAIIYAIGNMAGGYTASKVAIRFGSKFIKIAVTIMVFTMSFWLLYKNITG